MFKISFNGVYTTDVLKTSTTDYQAKRRNIALAFLMFFFDYQVALSFFKSVCSSQNELHIDIPNFAFHVRFCTFIFPTFPEDELNTYPKLTQIYSSSKSIKFWCFNSSNVDRFSPMENKFHIFGPKKGFVSNCECVGSQTCRLYVQRFKRTPKMCSVGKIVELFVS